MRIEKILTRWAWLIEHLLDTPGLTRERIFEDWNNSALSDKGTMPYTKSTFFYDLEKIGLFCGLDIKAETKCTKSGYFINNPDSVYDYKLERWMLNILQTQLSVNRCQHLRRRFIVDDFPSENGMLRHIIKCMEENRQLKIIYRRYGKDPETHIISPYCIKTYRNRFYVLGRFDTGRFRIFSFDRILKATILSETFEMDPDFDAEEFFYYFYGVFISVQDKNPTTVTIRAREDAKYYYRDVPIHHTQREILDTPDYADFQVTLFPTNDFLGEITQQRGRLEVMAPENIRSIVHGSIQFMDSQYK